QPSRCSPLSLHDALPIWRSVGIVIAFLAGIVACLVAMPVSRFIQRRIVSSRQSSSIEANQVTTVSQVLHLAIQGAPTGVTVVDQDRKSTRLNSSHVSISY